MRQLWLARKPDCDRFVTSGIGHGTNAKSWPVAPKFWTIRRMSYCAAVRNSAVDSYNREYHDTEYGFPIRSDSALFERLILEINQAGLSWLTILKKRAAFKTAYSGFDVQRVAAFNQNDRERLLQDEGIVRNRLKIEAAVNNAKVVAELSRTHGSFADWLDAAHPATLEEWKKLFKKTFFFTGGEIVREFLLSTGYLPDAHERDCPVYKQILKLKPAWKSAAVRRLM
jgi:DNA-3-methyladenine glycosylase I